MLEYAVVLVLVIVVLAGFALRRYRATRAAERPAAGGAATAHPASVAPECPAVGGAATARPASVAPKASVVAVPKPTLPNSVQSADAAPAPHLGAAQARAARRRFIAEARPGAVGFPRGRSFLFYNVHNFGDPFGADRAKEVAGLVARGAREGVEWVGLAEADPDRAAGEALAPYPHSLATSNGGTRLAVAWRDPLASALVVPTTGTRNCIMLATQAFRIMIVHLEIGARPRPDRAGDAATTAANRKIRAENSAERIRQLEALVSHEPDMLIGDFNFELNDPEGEWLRANGYTPVSGREPSTPFNRVDHCFVREELVGSFQPSDSTLLPVAHSDHRPLVQVLRPQ